MTLIAEGNTPVKVNSYYKDAAKVELVNIKWLAQVNEAEKFDSLADSLQAELDAAKAENAADKKALEDQISDLEADIEALQSDKAALEKQIADLKAALEKAEAEDNI